MDSTFDKIIVLGSSCSGKTTLGKKLAAIKQAKPIDLDDLNWLPGWKNCSTEDLLKKIEKEIWGEDRWIISGNYRNTHPLTMPQATCVIWLDFPLRIILWRMVKRTLTRIITKEEVCNGNYETIYGAFLDEENLFSYTINTYKDRKKQFLMLGEQYPHLEIIRLQSPKELTQFLNSLI